MVNWTDWVMQLIGTLIGAGVGFSLALYAERKRDKKNEDRDRVYTIGSILLEIERTLAVLDTPAVEITRSDTIPGAFEVEIVSPYLLGSAFDAAVHSGKLTLLNPDLQVELSTCYEAIRIARLHSDKVATFYAAEGGPAEQTSALDNANKYLTISFEMLENMLPSARDSLIKASGEIRTRK